MARTLHSGKRLLRHLLWPILAALVFAAGTAGTTGHAAAEAGLPIPRFVTVDTDEANLRTGPGWQYPTEWVLVRRGMPVEILAEFDVWRRVRDAEGIEGWVHQSMLSGRRSLLIVGEDVQMLRRGPDRESPVVARIEPGVLGRVLRCPAPDEQDAAAGERWCYCEVSGFRGWLPRAALWGLYPGETID